MDSLDVVRMFTLHTHDYTADSVQTTSCSNLSMSQPWASLAKHYETLYRKEEDQLALWGKNNNLSLNVEKTNKIVIDFRRACTHHPLLTIDSPAFAITAESFWASLNKLFTPGVGQFISFFLADPLKTQAPWDWMGRVYELPSSGLSTPVSSVCFRSLSYWKINHHPNPKVACTLEQVFFKDLSIWLQSLFPRSSDPYNLLFDSSWSVEQYKCQHSIMVNSTENFLHTIHTWQNLNIFWTVINLSCTLSECVTSMYSWYVNYISIIQHYYLLKLSGITQSHSRDWRHDMSIIKINYSPIS